MSPERMGGVVVLLLCAVAAAAAPAVRVGDVASVLGLRERELVGVGLVTGLAGRGDSSGSPLVAEALRSATAAFGVEVPLAELKSRNCAAVLVSAAAPSFVRAGERIAVSVSSIGDAKAIDDGVLLATVLRDASGQVSAVAQGRVQVAQDAKNKTAGTVAAGAVAQRDLVSSFTENGVVSLVMRNPDFATASAVAKAVSAAMKGSSVTVRDAALVDVGVPADRRAAVASFVAELQAVKVTPEPSNRVVVDAARGVVVVGESVRIGRVGVVHRRLQVAVGPMALTGSTGDRRQSAFLVDEPATVQDLVTLLQTLELGADDVIGILEAIDDAGALYGELVIR